MLILFLGGSLVSLWVLLIYSGNEVFWGALFGRINFERNGLLAIILTSGSLCALIGVIMTKWKRNKWLWSLFLVGILVGAFGLIVVSGGYILTALSPEAPDSLRYFALTIILTSGLLGGLIGFFVEGILHASRDKGTI